MPRVSSHHLPLRRRLLAAVAGVGLIAAGTGASGSRVSATGAAAVAAPAAAPVRYIDSTFTVDVQRDITYATAVDVDGNTEVLTLDAYTPHGDTSAARPVFIYAHGGFFALGDKSEGAGWGNRLAQRGYVVVSINYRLSSTFVTAPVDTDRERDEIDDARIDMQTAVRWVRSMATSLRIDPNKIAVGGSSAGAVTALGVAVHNEDVAVDQYPQYSSAVCTAVSYSGANDPLVVDSGDAGAIFHHGTADTIVPFEQAQQTRDAMIASGLPVQWNEYAGVGHGLNAESNAIADVRTIQWLADRVANAGSPCSPAVAAHHRVAGGQQTVFRGLAGRSAVMSITGVDNDLPGFVQILPCGTAPGGSSNLNLDSAGQTRSVLGVTRLGADGTACLYNLTRMHLVADLQGYFAPGSFDDIDDIRVLDTRSGSAAGIPAGSQTEVHGRPGTTAVASLVVTEAGGAGYVQVLPCGSTPGGSSNLDADAPGQTRATLVFLQFDAIGRACVFNQMRTQLIVDIQGYLAPSAVDDVADVRLVDTRVAAPPTAGSQVVVNGRANSTGVVSLVATGTTAPGYLQFLPCGSVPGSSSNLNVSVAGETLAGLAFVHFDASGRSCVYVQQSEHVVVDLQGYLTDGAFDDVADVRVLDTRG
ncbi:MAG: hypothetical protein JWN39_4245 [Ilumatobacteraceae bacterium]|nr:hypothetical protein [Ilumatobacteraceae bacterium]